MTTHRSPISFHSSGELFAPHGTASLQVAEDRFLDGPLIKSIIVDRTNAIISKVLAFSLGGDNTWRLWA